MLYAVLCWLQYSYDAVTRGQLGVAMVSCCRIPVLPMSSSLVRPVP